MDIQLTHHDWSSSTLLWSELLKAHPYTVLYFYPKDNTPWCTIESKNFSSLADEFMQLGCQIIGVSKDSHASHCSFISLFGLTIDLICDKTLELHHHFNTLGKKSMFGKSYEGTIRSTFLLDHSGQIIDERRDVSVLQHADHVLVQLKKRLKSD